MGRRTGRWRGGGRASRKRAEAKSCAGVTSATALSSVQARAAQWAFKALGPSTHDTKTAGRTVKATPPHRAGEERPSALAPCQRRPIHGQQQLHRRWLRDRIDGADGEAERWRQGRGREGSEEQEGKREARKGESRAGVRSAAALNSGHTSGRATGIRGPGFRQA